MGKFKISTVNGPQDTIKIIDLNINNHEKKDSIETVTIDRLEEVMDKVENETAQAWVFPEPKRDSKVRKIALRSARRERFMAQEVDRLNDELIRIEEGINANALIDSEARQKLMAVVDAKFEQLEDKIEGIVVQEPKEVKVERIVEVHNTIQHVLDKRLLFSNVALIILTILALILK